MKKNKIKKEKTPSNEFDSGKCMMKVDPLLVSISFVCICR